ncbi:MAG: hypothetical protein ACRYFZ_09735 [Janthinobacterium lividum]
MATAPETKQTLAEQALHAAEQNMTDVLTLWANGHTSDLVLGEALKDMKNDGLKLVKAARKAGQTPEERAFKADLLARAEAAEDQKEKLQTYVQALLNDLLNDPTLPVAIHKTLWAHRQSLTKTA